MSFFKIVFGFICSINIVTSFFHSYKTQFGYNTNELNETEDAFGKVKWIEQPLDHFNPKDNRTWKMPYIERTGLWKEGKPLFLFLTDDVVFPQFNYSTLFSELAQETNGALFIPGRRGYYGEINLEYLDSRQVLADYANLLKHIKSNPKYAASKVVVAGCVYGASYAAWLRLLYPDLVDVAYASSAPVLAKADFFEYLETVSDDFKQYGSHGCWEKIAEKFAHYEKAFQTKEGIEALKKEVNICDNCDLDKPLNQELFFFYTSSYFGGIATNVLMNVSEFRGFCDQNFTSKFRNMKELGQHFGNKDDCECPDFDDYIQYLREEKKASFYEYCAEFGHFRTANKQPFTKRPSIDFFYKICENLFGSDFNETRVKKGVEETNNRYGGLKPNVTKVIFVNGAVDPWSKLSILENLSPDAPAIKINDAMNCFDMRPSSEEDWEELKRTKAHIKSLIKSWIGEGESDEKH